jgi:hypothetical protein
MIELIALITFLCLALGGSFLLLTPSFKITALEIAPTQAKPNEPVKISFEIKNDGILTGTYIASLWVDGEPAGTKIIEVPGRGTRIETFEIVKDVPKIYSVRLDGLSGSFRVLSPAKFEVIDLSLQPQEAIVGEELSVLATVKNTGEAGGTYAAILTVDGVEEEIRNVEFAGGEVKTLTFKIVKNEPGDYTVGVGGLTKILTVRRGVTVSFQGGEISATENIMLHFEWTYGRLKPRLDFLLPNGLYEYYRNRPRLSTRNYSVYVTDPKDDNYLVKLVKGFNDLALRYNLPESEKVNLMIAFVQSMPYVPDNVSTSYDEYPRYPIETLVDNGGDCEDTSILMASLLQMMGHDVALIELPGHMAVGISGKFSGFYYEFEGKKYFYIETTGRGWRIGEMPPEFTGLKANLYPLKPIPVLTHTWGAKQVSSEIIELSIEVRNDGTAIAENVYVLAGFDAGENRLWNARESERFDLPPDSKADVTLHLTIPKDKFVRLIVQIVYQGYAVDQSYSNWFST